MGAVHVFGNIGFSVRVATYCYIMCRGPDDLTSDVKSPSTPLIIFLSVSFNAFQDENDNVCIVCYLSDFYL